MKSSHFYLLFIFVITFWVFCLQWEFEWSNFDLFSSIPQPDWLVHWTRKVSILRWLISLISWFILKRQLQIVKTKCSESLSTKQNKIVHYYIAEGKIIFSYSIIRCEGYSPVTVGLIKYACSSSSIPKTIWLIPNFFGRDCAKETWFHQYLISRSPAKNYMVAG